MIKPKIQTRQFYSCSFSDPSSLKAGDLVDIQVIRTGKRNHKIYGPFEVTPDMLAEMITNFDANVRGVDIAVDENHDDDHKAMGRYRKLYSPTPDSLRASIELTQHGAELLSKGMYKYFSAEIIRKDIDEETGKEIKNLLIGGGFTNRPFVKNMEPLQASEGASDIASFIYSQSFRMTKLTQLLGEYKDKKNLSFSEKTKLLMAFSEALASDDKPTDEQKADVETNLAKEDEVKSSATDEKTPADASDGDVTKTQLSETNTKLAETQAQLADVQKQLKLSELEKEFNTSVAFSETNKKGLFKPSQKDAYINFALSLNEGQKKQFSDLIKGIDLSLHGMFSQVGHSDGDGVSLSEDEKFDKAVKTKMAKENISYAKASETITKEEINAC